MSSGTSLLEVPHSQHYMEWKCHPIQSPWLRLIHGKENC